MLPPEGGVKGVALPYLLSGNTEENGAVLYFNRVAETPLSATFAVFAYG